MSIIRALTTAIVIVGGIVIQPTYAETLTVATFVPPTHHIHTRLFPWFADELAKRTGGDLELEVFPNGQLGAGPVQQYKRALEGVADITYGVSAYSPTIFPKTMLAILPGTSTTAVESTERIWQAYEEHLADEYQDVKLIGLFTVAGNLLAARRDVSTLEGLAGAKLVPYAAMTQPIIESLSAVPVQMPISDVYTGLSTGTIDAAYASYSNITAPWNFWDVAPYLVEDAPVMFAVIFVVMNKERYEGLSDANRAAIDELAGHVFSIEGAKSFDLADQEAIQQMADNPEKMARVTMVRVPATVRAQMMGIAQSGLDVVFKDYESRGIPNAAEIYGALNPSQ